jgi:hypothetical protein
MAAPRWDMAKDKDLPANPPPTREAQLAAALRANLRRRKAGAAKPRQPAAGKKDGDET